MIRAVVDTNVTVSALLFRGLPLEVVHAARDGRFIWVTSQALIWETRRVLQSKKFGLTVDQVQTLLVPLFQKVEIVSPTRPINIIQRNDPDNRVLECAVEGNCSYVVTGDRRDLLVLKHFHEIEIISVRGFLNRL